ncbi:hypothetical protein SPHINGOAX6_30407 [Sphingomonas sp. AX6]|nr:hypothetical protein SPHINGOAX6_30407 [Sphingomonas sp. AX6]
MPVRDQRFPMVARPRATRHPPVPVIHVIHRQDRVDYPFVRLAKGDTICLQAIDGTTGNQRKVNHLWLVRRKWVP